MVRRFLHITDFNFAKFNSPRVLEVILSEQALDKQNKVYREHRGQPGFIDDFLHLDARSADVDFLRHRPDLVHWMSDGSTVILPNLPYTDREQFISHPDKMKSDRDGFRLLAWCVHPSQLAETPFRNKLNRDDFATALHSDGYVPDLWPESRKHRHEKRPRIRELEESSQIPYRASVLDLGAKDIPWLKALRHETLQHLIKVYKIGPTDRVAMYFHPLPAESSTTLHMQIAVNQSLHPIETHNNVTIDQLIDGLSEGKSVKQMLLDKQQYYFLMEPKARDQFEQIGAKVTEIDNPYYRTNQVELKPDQASTLRVLQARTERRSERAAAHQRDPLADKLECKTHPLAVSGRPSAQR